jgi:hypothetical protein
MGMEDIYSRKSPRRLVTAGYAAAWVVVLAMALCAGGCTLLASIAAGLSPDPVDPPSYTGLAHQKCGILVLVDLGTQFEHPDFERDVARSLQEKLQKAIDVKTKEIEGLTLVDSRSVAQYMLDHPELQSAPITTIAARLPMSRLIYIDVDDFSTRSKETPDLYRGSLIAKVSVVEIANGKPTVPFTTDPIKVVYPPHTPEAGTTGQDDDKLYAQTIDAFTTKCAELFLPHPPPEDNQ